MYTAMAGKMDGAYNLSGKRFTQRKVMAGADLIWLGRGSDWNLNFECS